MTIDLNLTRIADAISKISIPGVTVRDVNELSASWASVPNVLYPNPDGWITDFAINYQAVTRGTASPANFVYTLHYRFLGVQVGDMAAFGASYAALVEKVVLIIQAIFAVDAPYSGAMNMELGAVTLGPLTDPAGNNYFGADFALSIEEIQN